MARVSRYRAAAFAAAIIIDLSLVTTSAFAAVDMAIGARAVVPNAPIAQCSMKAKNALDSVLQNAVEAGANTGQWLAYGTPDSNGLSTIAAAIHCFPVGKGYVATFTCSVELPTNPEPASALCTKLTTAFGAGK